MPEVSVHTSTVVMCDYGRGVNKSKVVKGLRSKITELMDVFDKLFALNLLQIRQS